jgi:hypothetical protein
MHKIREVLNTDRLGKLECSWEEEYIQNGR